MPSRLACRTVRLGITNTDSHSLESLDAYFNFVSHCWMLEVIELRKDNAKASHSLSPMLGIIQRRAQTVSRIAG